MVKRKRSTEEILKNYWSITLEHYGKKAQMQKVREELKELDEVIKIVGENWEKLNKLDGKKHKNMLKELKELMPGTPSERNDKKSLFWYDIIKLRLLEESADVINMICQICVMFDIRKKDVINMMHTKMQRTLERIDKEESNPKAT